MTTRRLLFACPHCGTAVFCRTSEQVTPIVRELRLHCKNDDCGCSFVAQLVAVRMVVPSMQPNPAVHLPMGKWRQPANDDAPPPPANDDRIAADLVTG